jgi:ribosome recycling factor
MNNNQNLGGLPLRQKEEVSSQQEQERDRVEQFDVTRKARQGALESVRKTLLQAEDSKLSRKDLMKVLKALYQYSVSADELTAATLKDMYKLLQAMAQQEMNVFALRTNLKTLIKGLEKKGLVVEDELRKLHDEEVLPLEIEELKKQRGSD